MTMLRSMYQWFLDTASDSRKGIRDVVVLMIPQGVSVLAAFVSTVLIARGLGTAGLGRYALVLSVSGIAASLSDLGIGQTAIRFASRAAAQGDIDGQMAVLRWTFRLRMVLAFLVTLAFILTAPVLADQIWHAADLTPLIRISLIGGIFAALASVPTIYFQSLKQFGRNAKINVAQTLISLLGIGIIAVTGAWSVQLVIIVSLVASAIGALVFLFSVPRAALVGRGPLPNTARGVMRKMWMNPLQDDSAVQLNDSDTPTTFVRYNLASTVIVLVVLRLDVWLMKVFLDESTIGIYHVATRFATPLTIILTAINGALWPRASAHVALDDIRELIRKTFRLSAAVGIVAALYAITVPIVAPMVFGSAYAGSTFLGQILCLRYAFAIVISPIGVIGYSLGMVRIYWLINLLQLVIVCIINIVFLPTLGPLASALALLANELIGVLLAGSIVWRKISVGRVS
jgi:O-antigen/teichoic acid export membrane protein